MKGRTDIELVERCLEGDNRAFEQLVDRYHLPMYRTALGITGNPDRAKDVTQNAFVKAWKNIDSYNPDYRFFSWLYRIIINESLNHVRDDKNHVHLSTPIADQENPYSQLVKMEEKLKVKKAIQCLQPDYRVVIHLRHFEELSYRDIAEILDIEVKTVKSRLYTARSRLREILSD